MARVQERRDQRFTAQRFKRGAKLEQACPWLLLTHFGNSSFPKILGEKLLSSFKTGGKEMLHLGHRGVQKRKGKQTHLQKIC